MTMHETKITPRPKKAPDLPPETYASLAHTIRSTKIKRVDAAVHDDLLVMMEALQLHLMDEEERITFESKSLEERAKDIAEREREVTKKIKTLAMLNKSQPAKRWWWR